MDIGWKEEELEIEIEEESPVRKKNNPKIFYNINLVLFSRFYTPVKTKFIKNIQELIEGQIEEEDNIFSNMQTEVEELLDVLDTVYINYDN